MPATTPDGSKRVGVSVGTTASVELPGGGGSALAFAGGFSHTNCSKEAFLMRKAGGNVSYTRLPSLPWDIAMAGIVAVGEPPPRPLPPPLLGGGWLVDSSRWQRYRC